MGDFVWHIKCIHMWSDASGNCRTLFLADFEFLTFLAHIWNFWIFFCHSWQVITSEDAEFNFNSHKINDSFSCEVTSWHGRPKRCKISNMGQKCQKFKISQNNCPAISWSIRPHMDALNMPNKIPHIGGYVVKRILRMVKLCQRYGLSKLGH